MKDFRGFKKPEINKVLTSELEDDGDDLREGEAGAKPRRRTSALCLMSSFTFSLKTCRKTTTEAAAHRPKKPFASDTSPAPMRAHARTPASSVSQLIPTQT